MDSTSPLPSTSPRSERVNEPAGRGCIVNSNRLTLVTLVVALAGFAGTAFAGASGACSDQIAFSGAIWHG